MSIAITRLRLANGRHRGWRGLSLLLAFTVMFVAWPHLELHSHAQGEQMHSHALDHEGQDQPASEDLDSPGVIHLHDASSVAWTLPSCQAQIATVPLAAWIPEPAFDTGALAARPPPHRPPIV